MILVTGGAGYIGSHTCVELISAGYKILILDDFSNSKPGVINRIREISGGSVEVIRGDVRNPDLLQDLFARHDIEAVIHFAGLKAVGESVSSPLRYYEVNVGGTLTLLHAMRYAGCRQLVFSSSATVYGEPDVCPIDESAMIRPTNPYGASKAMIERILLDLGNSAEKWSVAILRYFNPVGAHESGRIGEDPDGVPNNLMPYVAKVADNKLPELTIFGADYPTRDGTGERDYIHVVDLAHGHLAALRALPTWRGVVPVNLGTGRGTTVRELLDAFQVACGRDIPYRIGARRPGDVASCFAAVSRAERLLGWRAMLGVNRMCIDTWRWQQGNPLGYESGE